MVVQDEAAASGKARLTVSIDANLVEAANAAVHEGRARSVSAWVNRALQCEAERDRRQRALRDVIADYEVEFGVITDDEMRRVRQADERAAEIVRRRVEKRQRALS